MANSIATYTDSQIMKCLLTHDFNLIGKRFEDNFITKIKTGAFFEATNLDEVVLPAVTHIGSMAFAGTNLTTLTLTWANIVSIGIGAFSSADDAYSTRGGEPPVSLQSFTIVATVTGDIPLLSPSQRRLQSLVRYLGSAADH